MKTTIILIALATIALFALCQADVSLNYPSSLDYVRSLSTPEKTWKAGINKNFVGMSKTDVKKLLGWRKELERKDLDPAPLSPLPESSIPTSFTSSTNWPNCKTIGTIYNQARCGSCWAFGGVEAASDRFCIASKGAINRIYSFAEIVECSNEADGCDGGSASAVWDFIQSPGIVTDTCYPYYIPTCPPAQQPCLNFVDTPNCWSNNTCVDGSNWGKDIATVSSVYGLNSVAAAQTDMMTNGPIEACFDVYEDFLNYKSGVYIYDGTSEFLGGHCIKISGWGVENGQLYWLCNNSWTTSWGDKGYFKIQRGTDMCGIEDDLVAGTPSTSNVASK